MAINENYLSNECYNPDKWSGTRENFQSGMERGREIAEKLYTDDFVLGHISDQCKFLKQDDEMLENEDLFFIQCKRLDFNEVTGDYIEGGAAYEAGFHKAIHEVWESRFIVNWLEVKAEYWKDPNRECPESAPKL